MRVARLLVPALALALLALALEPATGSVRAGAHPLEAVCDSLQERAAASDAQVGLVIIALGRDARCSVNAGETFRTASLYKLIVLAAAYRQSDRGEFSLDETITLEDRHYIDDPPESRPSQPLEISARESIRRMVVFSDNASAHALRERLGTGVVAATPDRLGLDDTSVGWEFVTTPADIARFFDLLYRGEMVSARASEQMLAVLRAQELNDLIPASLPAGTEIAHKTGLVDKYLHDAGIVSAPGGDYVLVLLTHWERAIEDAYLAIHDLTTLSYAAFEAPLPPSAPSQPAVVEAAAGAPGTVDLALARVAEQPVVTASAPPIVPAGTATSSGGWWRPFRGSTPLLAALAPAALIPLVIVFARRRVVAVRAASAGAAPAVVLAQAQAIATTQYAVARYATVESGAIAATRRDRRMRFGSRSNRREDVERAVDASPAARAGDGQPAESPRLERLAEYFNAQFELLDQTRSQVEQEIAPLTELLTRQRTTMRLLLTNLDQRLRPLNDYADSEESNLAALEERLDGDGTEFVWRSFRDYLAQQRRRIDETRTRIDDQRQPLLEFGKDQTETVEVALSRFDSEIEALEGNLAEQRKVMMRMLDAMRSDSFLAVKEFLSGREGALAETAESGVTDPAEMSVTLRRLDTEAGQISPDDSNLGAVLDASQSADERLGAASPAGPRALPSVSQPPQSEDEDAAGRTGASA